VARNALSLVFAVTTFVAAVLSGCSRQVLPVTSTTGTAIVRFIVKDVQGSPLQGAKVVSSVQPAGQVKITGMTDVRGEVSFAAVTIGEYEFVVSRFGFLQTEVALTATRQDTTVTVNLTYTSVNYTTTTPLNSAIPITFADLIAQPNNYDRQLVKVQGFWFDGFEIVVLASRLEPSTFAPGNVQPAGDLIWMKGGLPQPVSNDLHLQPNNPTGYPAHYGEVVVTGIFEFGTRYGHMDAYRFQLTVLDATTA
jgi:hypothetical protein